jgi:CTP:molybdopterin cytidylyltransferase MocA
MVTPNTAQSLDVIITAGDRHASRPVFGESKAFLPIAGVPLFHYVLGAVEQARCTARIFVVGDKARLEHSLATSPAPFRGTRPLVLLEQGHTLYDNVWNAFLHTLPDYTPGMDWRVYTETAAVDKAVLVLSGDMPLATPFELDEFVDGCDLARYDYCLGLSTESTLQAYYPQAGRPGIRMAYFIVRDRAVRQNNLHLVKPFRLGNRAYIQKMYDLRYQREWRNMARLCLELWQTRDASARIVWAFLCLHVARLLAKHGWQRLPLFRPLLLELPMLASLLSQLLRTRFTTVITHYGGCALDVDNADQYEAIRHNFDRWLAYQHDLAKELKQGEGTRA